MLFRSVQGDLDRVRSDYVVKLLAIAERFVRQGATVVIYLNGPRFDGLEGSIEGYCTPQWYKATLDPSCSVSAGSFVDQRRHDFADIFKWADDSKRIVWDGVDETTCSRGVCTATHYKDEAHFRPYYANYIFHRFQQSHPDLFVPAGSDQGDRAVSDRADARR